MSESNWKLLSDDRLEQLKDAAHNYDQLSRIACGELFYEIARLNAVLTESQRYAVRWKNTASGWAKQLTIWKQANLESLASLSASQEEVKKLAEELRELKAREKAPSHVSEEIKPCPFCGGKPELEIDEDDAILSTVRCRDLECAMGHQEPVYVFAWNKRASNDENSSLRLELEKTKAERAKFEHYYRCQQKIVTDAHSAFHETDLMHENEDEFNIAEQIRIIARDRDSLKAALSLSREEASSRGWVSVETQLPEKGVKVLVLQRDGDIAVDWDEGVAKFPCWAYSAIDSTSMISVTHWMPMPPPPVTLEAAKKEEVETTQTASPSESTPATPKTSLRESKQALPQPTPKLI